MPVHAPTFAQHLLIVPVANMAGAIPATPSGLGDAGSGGRSALYQAVPGNSGIVPGDGTLVALAHRVTMIAVAMIGMVYYVSQRAELQATCSRSGSGRRGLSRGSPCNGYAFVGWMISENQPVE